MAAGCGGRATRQVERLAVPPFEDLSSGAGAAWAGQAISEAVAAGVSGSSRVHPVRVPGSREAALAGATSVLRGYFVVSGGRMRVQAERRDIPSGRTVSRFSVEEQFPERLLEAAEAVARWIEPEARPFDTRSTESLRAFAQGMNSEEVVAAAAEFARSVSLDPDFGAAYVAWARALLLSGDRGGAASLIEKARARGAGIRELRRIDLDLLRAAVTGDAALRRESLLALSRATPADAEVFRQLAHEDKAARRYDSAAGFYRQAAALDPADQSAWNLLGYTEAARRNLGAARDALEQYRRLAPRDANPLDSLGDVHFHLGAFREAEKYYLEAHDRDRAFLGGATLYKAARARLMTGDIAGANGIFQGIQAAGPLADCRKAQWLYLTGRKAEAVAEMRRVTAPELQPLAAAQLAVWGWLGGSRGQAPAGSPAARRLAVARDLLDRRFAEAIPSLKELSEAADPVGSDRAGGLLAWALIETGRIQDAAPLLEVYGVPPAGLEDPLVYLVFPREFELRAVVFDKLGRQGEASRMREIYRKLGGERTAPTASP